VKERPILFSALMVRAILDGSKTQTRRIVKPGPMLKWFGASERIRIENVKDCLRVLDGGRTHNYSGLLASDSEYPEEGAVEVNCPFGLPGDRLWVRETFYRDSMWYPSRFSSVVRALALSPSGMLEAMDYRATHSCLAYEAGCPCNPDGDGKRSEWRPSIHMPRWASRITLEIVSVRVERLQDISSADVLAEGLKFMCDGSAISPLEDGRVGGGPQSAFAYLWDSLNAKRAPWSSNPWVWVVEFKRV
jgi:hypothetical protein